MLMDYSSFEITYHVEIAIVIDATGGMNPIIQELKDNAMDFYRRFAEIMKKEGEKLSVMRVKIIVFRDFAYNGDRALEESKFFNLPEENEDFHNYVEQIQVFGGGDEPANALEALAVAMRSDWTTEKKPGIVALRHVILLFTDSIAAPLKDASRPWSSKCARVDNPIYPENMPANLEELGHMWEGELGGMPNKRSKRIVLFAPNVQPWNEIVWNQSWQLYSKPDGLADVDINILIDIACNCLF